MTMAKKKTTAPKPARKPDPKPDPKPVTENLIEIRSCKMGSFCISSGLLTVVVNDTNGMKIEKTVPFSGGVNLSLS